MRATIDNEGRLVIPASLREQLGLRPGTRLDLVVEDGSVRLVRQVRRPELVRRGGRLIARPTASRRSLPNVDFAVLVAAERRRLPR